MDYEVTTGNKVNFAPSSTVEEILQNVGSTLSTIMTEVRYMNDFAVDGIILDMPLNQVQGKLSAIIIRAIKKYEPRFEVQKISFKGDPQNGQIQPVVKGIINA